MSVARSAYRWLLRLLPTQLRRDHGADIEELFIVELERARRRGRLAAARVWAGAIADVVARAPREHWRRVRQDESYMKTLIADLRFAFRTFTRQPGGTALIVGTLALAIAANTAVFSLVDAVLFRPLPYPNASRLVDLNERAPAWDLEFTGVSYADFDVWQRNARTFDGMALWEETSVNLSDGTRSERADGQLVTHNLARVLGVIPVVGRTFTADEDVPNGPNVVMLGHRLWQERFGGRATAVGKTIRINSRSYTIVGVLPANVTLSGPTSFWLPMGLDARAATAGNYSYEGVGRLKPGVTIAQAHTDLQRAHEEIWRERDSTRTVSPRIMPLRDRLTDEYKTIGIALGAGVALVLVIACANVAGAMLARSVFRRRELAIRVALGASSRRITRQLLTEALALSAMAGVAGTLVGRSGIGLLVAGMDDIPPWLQLNVDARAVLFSVAIVVGTALLFGLVPLLQLRRGSASGALVGTGRPTTGSLPERRILDGLVVVEIALATVLLVAGGLLLRAYGNLRDVDPGFRVDGVATFRLSLPAEKYRDGLAQRRLYETLIARLEALPGVSDAGAVTCAPFTCHWGVMFDADEKSPKARGQAEPVALARLATGGYFGTMGIRLLHGRFFDEGEGAPNGPIPIVINDLLAKQLWPRRENAVGQTMRFRGDTAAGHTLTVVGIVKDARHYGLEQPMRPSAYLPITIMSRAGNFPRFSFVARTGGDPAALFTEIRRVVRELDPELPMFDTRTMHTALERSLASRRAIALWLASFAAVALALAVGGIYAVLSYVVGRRRQEIGIRMALGAQQRQVLALIVRQGLTLVALGLIVGVPAALGGIRLLSSLLVGVTTSDPLTLASVMSVLVLTGLASALIPARRAASVDPRVALGDGG